MQKIFNASYVIRWLNALFGWIGVRWHRSLIVTWFLSSSGDRKLSDYSILTKLARYSHSGLCHIFEKLRLNRLFKNSIFQQAFLWCLLPVALAPFIPTMALLAFVVVGTFSLVVRFGSNRKQQLFTTPVNKYIAIFSGVYLISVFTSVTISDSIYTGLLSILFALFAIILDNAVTSKRQADLIIKVFVIMGAGVALYGVYQYVFYDPATAGLWVDTDRFSDIYNRVYSTLENPNVLAEYLLLVTPFAAACMITGKSLLQKLFFFGCFAVMAVCMIVTFSRGGYIGLILAAAIFLVMLDSRFIFVGILALIALYFVLPQSVIERFTSIGDMTDTSTSYRVYIWLGTIAMLKDYWLSGIGPGNAAFNVVYPAYSYNTIKAPHAHNLYLQLMCDVGIVGLVLFGLILLSFFRRTFTAFSKERDRSTKIYLIAAISSVSGFLLQGMTDYSFYNNRVALLFWVVIGLGAVLARRSTMEEGYYLWSKS